MQLKEKSYNTPKNQKSEDTKKDLLINADECDTIFLVDYSDGFTIP